MIRPSLVRPASAAACVLALCIAPTEVRADNIAYSITNTNANTSTGSTTLGFHFQANSSILATQLGVYDVGLNGLTQSHPIGLWDSSGNLLATATVPAGTAAPLTAQFRYLPISPTLLTAGQTYHIGALYQNDNEIIALASGFVTDPAITFLSAVLGGGSGLSDPTFAVSVNPGYFGPNFQFVPAVAVPEPASLSLFGLTMLAGLGAAWRRRTW